MEAWYAGQEQGAAVACVLLGDVDPSGQLPLTFPAALAQAPAATAPQYPGVGGKVEYSDGLFVGYRGYEKQAIEPQYAFGYGLSYTTFEYSGLALDSTVSDGTEPVRVSLEAANTGARAGSTVAQVYVRLPPGLGAPVKRLAGWVRVSLEPGERRRAEVLIAPSSPEHPLSFWNVGTHAWEIADGEYAFYLGASASDIRATARIQLRKPEQGQAGAS